MIEAVPTCRVAICKRRPSWPDHCLTTCYDDLQPLHRRDGLNLQRESGRSSDSMGEAGQIRQPVILLRRNRGLS